MHTTLIAADELAELSPNEVRVFDCRFDLKDPQAGAALFKAGHIPGATYMHLDQDLSGKVEPGRTGRHPLPDREAFRAILRAHGVEGETQAVAYDDAGGMFAARLWWMVRWTGHFRVAVLDGGHQAWLAHERDLDAVPPKPDRPSLATASPSARPADAGNASDPATPTVPPVSMREVREYLDAGTWTLIDARANDRFHGRNETIDPKAGHIAGAINAPFQDNLGADGRFLDPASLRRRFEILLATKADRPVACYCGSGVTAAHNVLAMVHAGLREPALYPGSWSEWITDPRNPIET